MDTYIVNINTEHLHMTDEDFFQFCGQHRELRIEKDANQNIIIMSPLASDFDSYNLKIASQLDAWNDKSKSGQAFGPTAGFILPNGAMRSPDAAWMSTERRNSQPKEAGRRFLKLCPEFIIELKSPSDRLKDLKTKMEEWMENGCKLGFLIDSDDKKVYIYKPNHDVIEKSIAEKISGEDLMPGFELDLGFLLGDRI